MVPSFNITFSTIGAALFLGTRPSHTRLVGLSLIFAGVATIFAQGLAQTNTSQLYGDLLYVLGGLAYAIYTVSSQKFRVGARHAASIVLVFSAVLFVPVYLPFLPHSLAQAPIEELATQAVFQGVVTSILAIFLFSSAIVRRGPCRGVPGSDAGLHAFVRNPHSCRMANGNGMACAWNDRDRNAGCGGNSQTTDGRVSSKMGARSTVTGHPDIAAVQ